MPVRHPLSRGLAILALSTFALLASAATPTVRTYTGLAHARDGGQLLYREQHWIYHDHGKPARLVLYTCPDGKAFARKHLDGPLDSSAPDFDFLDARSGYRAGAHKRDGKLQVYVQQNAQANRRSKLLPLTKDAVIDAGFDAYVHTHWDALAQSDATVPFLLPSDLKYIDIKLSGSSDTTEHGQRVRKLRMRLAAWYGFAVPAIHLTYSVDGHRLLRYVGMGTIRDAKGDNQNIRVDFPADARHDDVPQAQLQKALNEPLNGRCDA